MPVDGGEGGPGVVVAHDCVREDQRVQLGLKRGARQVEVDVRIVVHVACPSVKLRYYAYG